MDEKEKRKVKNRTRKNRIVFYIDDDELKFIHGKMKALHITNREAYLRKMAIDGKCIRNDYSDLEKAVRRNNYLVDNVANNINQIAKRVNSTNNFYGEDLKSLQEQINELMERQIEIMKLFMSITEE